MVNSNNPVIGYQVAVPPFLTPALADEHLAEPYYALLRALFTRTGDGSGIPFFPPADVTDAGASQTTASPLLPILNFITASGKGVRMPTQMSRGNFLICVNITTGQTVKIYPAKGVQINALGANNPYTTAVGLCAQIFWFQTALQCWSTVLG
jgi:hypothetical protein